MIKKYLFLTLLITGFSSKCATEEIKKSTDSKSIAESKYSDAATQTLYQIIIKPRNISLVHDKEVKEDVEAAKKAITEGANVNAQIGDKKYSLLQHAMTSPLPKLEVIEILLKSGADPNLKDYKSRDSKKFAQEFFAPYLSTHRFKWAKTERNIDIAERPKYHVYLLALGIIDLLNKYAPKISK